MDSIDSRNRVQDRDTRGVYGSGSGDCDARYGLDDGQPESEACPGPEWEQVVMAGGSGVGDLIVYVVCAAIIVSSSRSSPWSPNMLASPVDESVGDGRWTGDMRGECGDWAGAASGMGAAADKERERDGPSAALLDKVRLRTLDLKGNDLCCRARAGEGSVGMIEESELAKSIQLDDKKIESNAVDRGLGARAYCAARGDHQENPPTAISQHCPQFMAIDSKNHD
ncbi:hypothetical protein DFH07DRAFT_984066 [Mycena maculata]|uniref:Uncharacterized protein n=1 Tax=Mycena maculata TaxID=230809 RepID=A0AAD7IBT1_9AGAR|nr:hypothetical protein DFH07DRAFT_984066 [Mycena maculata]